MTPPAPQLPPVLTAPPTPSYNFPPSSEEDRQKMQAYEQWLNQNEQNIGAQMKHYDEAIAKLRKHKKSLNSKLRNVKKNNGELNESEKAELDGVTKETNDMQKVIEKLRKEQKKHNTARTDHNNKRQSSQPAGVPGGPPGMAGPGMPVGPEGPRPPMQQQGPMQPQQQQGLPPGAAPVTAPGNMVPRPPMPPNQPKISGYSMAP